MFEKTPLFAESWNVAFRQKTVGTVLTDKSSVFTIVPNSFRYWAADPFLFEYDGITYIFAELYDYVLCRGCLGYCQIKNGKTSAWTKVLQEDFHLSYPVIFQRDGEILMMPESGADKTLSLYRAVHFPDRWEKVSFLRDNAVLADSTPFDCNGKKYILSYDMTDLQNIRLKILDMDNPDMDRVLTVDSLELRRPAGNFFAVNDKVYRPAQDCTSDYGQGLVFYECDFSREYNEYIVQKIYPAELNFSRRIFLDGMHTYNANNDYEVIDLKTRRFNILNFYFRFLSKIRRFF